MGVQGIGVTSPLLPRSITYARWGGRREGRKGEGEEGVKGGRGGGKRREGGNEGRKCVIGGMGSVQSEGYQ